MSSPTTFDFGSAVTSGTITGLSANTFYFIQVRASNGSGNSSWSTPPIPAFTGPNCTLSPTSPDITTTGWTNEGGLSSFNATLASGNGTTEYALSPSGNTEPLVVTLENPPPNFGSALAYCLAVLTQNASVSSSSNALNVAAFESNGSTGLGTGEVVVEGSSSPTWTYNTASVGGGYNAAAWTNAQLNFSLASGAAGQTSVFLAYVIVGYSLAPSVPAPLAGAQGVGAYPFGYTNAQRRNRIEGYRFQYR